MLCLQSTESCHEVLRGLPHEAGAGGDAVRSAELVDTVVLVVLRAGVGVAGGNLGGAQELDVAVGEDEV